MRAELTFEINKKLSIYFGIFMIFLIWSCSKEQIVPNSTQSNSSSSVDPIAYLTGRKTNTTKVLMHYMPWFETNQSSFNGKWGSHWTMANKDPNQFVDGSSTRRQLASFFYPLIGPYHSGDSEVIEYHLLLMKYAGVDAVVVDWYGTHDVYDYRINFENTDQLIKRTSEVGIDFGIVYEPSINTNVENLKGISRSQAAINDMNFLRGNYFNQSNYLKINSENVLLVFGNSFIASEWNTIFKSANVSPRAYFLQNTTANLKTMSPLPGEFFWVNSTDSLGQRNWNNNFQGLKISGAYPGFKDYYLAGGWTNSHLNWEIPLGIRTFKDRLNFVKNSNFNIVQIQTFNDFGEGTMLEPTQEFGFSFLTELQQYTGSPYTVKELELIYKYYLIRTKFKSSISDLKAKEVYNYLISWKVAEAEKLINQYVK
jgi:hypothetical protein